MNSSSTDSTARFDSASSGVLGQIDLAASPFCGELFSRESLERGRWILRNGRVRVVTANVQGGFAGVFGQVAETAGGPQAEVSIVVHRGNDGWRVEGRSDRSKTRNNEHVAALLMAAMVEKGAVRDLSFGLGRLQCTLHLFSADVRAGILHWDDSDARAVLENMPLDRIEGENPRIESRLARWG